MQLKNFQDNEKELWEKFIKENAFDGGFLQSWQWGEFKKSFGNKIWRLGLEEDGKVLIVSLVLQHKKLGFNFLYIPRGLVIAKEVIHQMRAEEVLNNFLGALKNLALAEKSIFLRVDPNWPSDVLPKTILQKFGFKEMPNLIQPIHTLIIDLSKTPEEILASMHQKTRYNIGLAERKGMNIKISADPADVSIFYNLVTKTKERQNIKIHNKNYFKKMLELIGKDEMVKIFIAEFQGKHLAAILVAFYNDRAYYLHGGSDFSFRHLMAPHLLQWQAILFAKGKGYKFYDLWGVAPEGKMLKREEKWAGITRFKRGFDPIAPIIEYVGLFELPCMSRVYKIKEFLKYI